MIREVYTQSKRLVALALAVLLSSVPAMAGLTIIGSNGITTSGADGVVFNETSGITTSGADGILAFGPNGITTSGADGITTSGADGITTSGADGIMATGADSIAIARADGITTSGADGVTITTGDGSTYRADSVTIRNPTGITTSGADSVIATGVNGITTSGADTNIGHADGITTSGADTLGINSADTVIAIGLDGVRFAITPNSITIRGVDGITTSGADGITISGADSLVRTGVNAISAAIQNVQVATGLRSVDPELAILLNRLTDDSNVDAVLVYHHLPNDADIADLQALGVLGGTRYRALPVIAVTTTKRRLNAISHLPSIRSLYTNRTFQWNLDSAARNLTGVERVRRNTELASANSGLAVSGRGVTVAVLDTGVDGMHGDLSGRVIQNLKLADTQSVGVGFSYPVAAPNLPNTDQAYGHGTFVAGIIAGNGQQSAGKYAGVAPNANILGLSAGDASLVFVLSGFDYLLTNGAAFNVRVVNCSFSANTVFDVNDPVNVATKMLTDNGVNVVFSAGNTGPGPDTLNPYSVAPWVIGTGATDNQGRLAGFSSRGDFGSPLFRPTLVAPGVNTVSLRASTVAALTTAEGLAAPDAGLSPTEIPYYTTGNGTSFSAPQVAGVIALMLEVNPQLTPAQVRDILQRTATPLPPYYAHEVGAGMLNAQAAVLEAAFPQRRFGQWRGIAYQGQVQFINSAPQVFSGAVTPGSANDSPINFAPDVLRASVQIAWGGLSASTLALTMLNTQGERQTPASKLNSPGLTGRRQRSVIDFPGAGAWKARVEHAAGPLGPQSVSSNGSAELTNSRYGPQAYTGTIQTTTARYTPMTDLNGLDSASISEIRQNFRGLVMSPVGQRFRPGFGITRADLAMALVLGGRVPQYLPAQSSYTDIRDRATMLFVESAQAAPNGALFPSTTPGGAFLPDSGVDRLTAVIALVRAAGLRQQAESGANTLTCTDATSIPASLRGYVAVAVQNGLIKLNGTTFNPQGSFTRLDLSHAMARIATLAA
jgi:serine protease AprX